MKRHDIDVISLMGGLLFAGLAAVFALHALGAFDVDLRAAPAVALIVAGLGGIVAAITSSGRTSSGRTSSGRTSSGRGAERRDDEPHAGQPFDPEAVSTDQVPES